MSIINSALKRRDFITTSLIGTVSLGLPMLFNAAPAQASVGVASPASGVVPGDTRIREFRIDMPDSALVDLRQRLAATRWPDRETVPDTSQGVQLARLQADRKSVV